MPNENIQKVVELARSYIGVPYKYGATEADVPTVFDCSLFTQYIFRQVGVELPRSTILQAEHGTEIELADIQPGDLIFVHGERGFYNKKFPQGIGHVMIFAGDGKAIHAAGERLNDYPEKIVEAGAVREENLDTALELYKPLVVIKRLIEDR